LLQIYNKNELYLLLNIEIKVLTIKY